MVDWDIFLSGQLAAAGTSHETAIVTAHALTSKYYSRIMLVTRICLLLPVLCRHNGRKPIANTEAARVITDRKTDRHTIQQLLPLRMHTKV